MSLPTPFFAAAVAHNTKEVCSRVVGGDDLDVEIVELVLRFAHGDALENVDEHLFELFVVADRLLTSSR